MDEAKAREILAEYCTIESDNGLYYPEHVAWSPKGQYIRLNNDFNVDALEAIIWWMRNKNVNIEELRAAINKGAKK